MMAKNDKKLATKSMANWPRKHNHGPVVSPEVIANNGDVTITRTTT